MGFSMEYPTKKAFFCFILAIQQKSRCFWGILWHKKKKTTIRPSEQMVVYHLTDEIGAVCPFGKGRLNAGFFSGSNTF